MGAPIRAEYFTEDDRERFSRRLDEQLRALSEVLGRPGFGAGPRSLGVELELGLVDGDGRATPIADRIIAEAGTTAVTPELGAFDLEIGTEPVLLGGGRPFSALCSDAIERVRRLREIATRHGVRAVPIGILPTLRIEDFGPSTITALPRYRALVREMMAQRGGDLEIAIEGDDSLRLSSRDVVSMEAANAAFQVHLRVEPHEFARLYNAALLVSGPLIAAAANSPTFLGKKLWHETRIALFKQAGDHRPRHPDGDFELPPRIDFGGSWVRDGAHELFLESVALHPLLLAECARAEDSLALARAGVVPRLDELRLHHGTVWNWNRPVYDPDGGGNLRIELRSLPAGPSFEDMFANAAFLVGAVLGIADRMPEITAGLPFAAAKRNFFLAAREGLGAELAWPSHTGGTPVRRRASDALLELLPFAHEGLAESGVDVDERARFLGVFEARVRSHRTPAVWQREALGQIQASGRRGYDALSELLERYIAGFDSHLPVHAWRLDPRAHGAAQASRQEAGLV